MKNITLAIDEKLLEASRDYARKHHTSLNAMVRELLKREVAGGEGEAGLDHFLKVVKEARGDSRGWKWKREDVYDRKVLR